jgi:hypothetical protein
MLLKILLITRKNFPYNSYLVSWEINFVGCSTQSYKGRIVSKFGSFFDDH